MLGAGSSDPANHQVLAADQAHALGCMLLPVLSSLFTECEEALQDSSVLDKYHRGKKFTVTPGSCYENDLTVDESYFIFLLPVGVALASGTTPPRGVIGDDLFSTAAQGGQPGLTFVIRAFTAYKPDAAKALQEIAVTNKQALGKSYPSVPQGTTLVNSYVTTVVSADNPLVENDLAVGYAACLGEKKAALLQ